jgi:hypothetical protein
MSKRFTMRDAVGFIVAGLQNVEEGNALLTGNGRIVFDKPLSTLEVDQTARGEVNEETYFVTRTE